MERDEWLEELERLALRFERQTLPYQQASLRDDASELQYAARRDHHWELGDTLARIASREETSPTDALRRAGDTLQEDPK